MSYSTQTAPTPKHYRNALLHDVLFIILGIVIAIVCVQTGLLDMLIGLARDYYMIAAFIAGVFFTSVFSLAPASIALVKIAEHAPFPWVAFWGGLGAMCGDLILFFFIRDRFLEDIRHVFKKKFAARILHTFHFGFLKWLSPVLGALIIASPLPDELGISLMGMSRIRTAVLMPISFIMNVLGIYLIVKLASFV
jgi:hypothetical protein